MGRVVTFNYDSLNRLISVDVPKMDDAGTRTAVRLHYKTLTLNPGWASGITTDTNNAAPYVVDGIYYPGTSTGYWFNNSDSYSSYGMISKVIEQRGMSWSGTAGDQGTISAGTMSKEADYNYTLTPIYTLTDAPTYTTLTESWAGMDTAAAVTTYAVNNNDTYYFPASGDPAYHNGGSSPARSIAVTQPNGVVNTQYSYRTPGQWMDGLVFRDETRDPTTNALLAMGDAGWEQGSYDSPRPFHTYAVDEKGQALRTDYTYGSNYNQVTSQKEYGYDNTTLLKETQNTYESSSSYASRHIFSLVKSTEIYDGSGNRVAKTDYEYDGNAVVNGTGNPNLQNTPDVTHHLSTYDPFTTETQQVPDYCYVWNPSSSDPPCEYEGEEVWVYTAGGYYTNCGCDYWHYNDVSVYDPNTIFRGNLTKTTVYTDAANASPSGPIAQTKQYDETGNLVAESASCCELKTYIYDDPNTTEIDTQYAYPVIQTRGSSDPNSTIRNTTSAVYDFNTGLVEQSTDPNGRTSTTTYNADTLRPMQTTASTGAYKQTTFDESAMTITDEVFDLTTSGPITAGKTKTYLNGLGLVVRQDDIGPSNVTDITETKYTNLGEVWKQSRPYRSGDTVQWSEKIYDLQGRVTKIVEPDGSETKAFYNETQRPDSASNLAGSTVRVMDAWGRERWGRYDALGRLSEVAEPNPASTGSAVNVAAASNGGVATASSQYTSGYSPAKTIDGDRNGSNWTSGGGWIDGTYNTYPDWLQVDFAGNKTIGEIDVFTVQDDYANPVNPTDTQTFSAWGITGFDVQYWDGSAWVTVPSGSVTGNNKIWRKFTFTPVTTSKIRVLVNGAANSFSRITEVEAWTPTTSSSITGSVFDTGSLVTNYSYDTLGRLTGTNQGGQVRSFKYDSLGRLIRQKLAEQTATINDLGAYVGSGGLWSSAFVYDDRSNVTQRTDARGAKTNYSYQISGGGDDPLNRIQSISYDLSGTHDTSKPIPTAPTVTYEYMTTGDQDRLKKVTATGVSTDELVYDTEGRVTDETKTFLTRASYPLVTSYTYDSLNRTTSMRLPAQYGLSGDPRKFVYYDFDSSSRLTTLQYGTALSKVQQAGDIAYNATDQTTSINIGPSGANQVNEQYTFDPQTGLLTNQKAVAGTNTLVDLTYDYNRNNSAGSLNGKTGHLTRVLDNLEHKKDREYQFDAVGRLTVAKGGENGTLSQQSYGYDRYGNRTSVAATGVAADNTTMSADGIPNLTFNTANNQITTSNANGQFEYDVSGNQTRALDKDGANWIRYEYDAANRPVNIRQGNGPNDGTLIESQQFGVGNERIALTDAVTNQKIWYGDAVEYTESNGSGTLSWSKTCTYLGDSLLSTITPDGAGGETVEYNHPDRLGTKLVTNQAAGTNSEQTTLPFGKALDAESTLTTNPKRFTSYERSAPTGLDYAINRTYDSKQGRFTQVDPMGFGASTLSDPQSLNLYAYCANDPINHLDPSGLGFFSFLKKLFKWVLIAIAVIVAVITIVGVFTVPLTLGSVLGAISAGTGAASSVLNGLGYTKLARMFGLVAMVTGFGSIISTKLGVGMHFAKDIAQDIASAANKAAWSGIFTGVGAVANSFSQTGKKKETKEHRRNRLIKSSVASALWRLKNVPGCKEFIQEEFKTLDPETVLKQIYADGNIKPNDISGGTIVAQSPTGTGSSGTPTYLSDIWFDGYGLNVNLNQTNRRTLTILHELKHRIGTPHGKDANGVDRDEDYFDKGIAKHCFGVNS